MKKFEVRTVKAATADEYAKALTTELNRAERFTEKGWTYSVEERPLALVTPETGFLAIVRMSRELTDVELQARRSPKGGDASPATSSVMAEAA